MTKRLKAWKSRKKMTSCVYYRNRADLPLVHQAAEKTGEKFCDFKYEAIMRRVREVLKEERVG